MNPPAQLFVPVDGSQSDDTANLAVEDVAIGGTRGMKRKDSASCKDEREGACKRPRKSQSPSLLLTFSSVASAASYQKYKDRTAFRGNFLVTVMNDVFCEAANLAVEDDVISGTGSRKRKVSLEDISARSSKRARSSQSCASIEGVARKRRVSCESERRTAQKSESSSLHSSSPSSAAPSSSSSSSSSSGDSSQADLRGIYESKYKEETPLGEGNFGTVFAGYRIEDRLPVAIKHIAQTDVKRKAVTVRGETVDVPLEVLLLALMASSRGTVQLLDWFDLDEEVIIILEQPVPCIDLLNFLENANGRLQEDMAKEIMKQLLDAAAETLSAGTPDYFSPEMFKDSSYTAGPTTVWQLGVVLYALLHGRLPFGTRKKTLYKMPKIRKQLSAECCHFLRHCFTKCPEVRPTLEELQKHPWLQ
ncbi:hypothetical protein LDENG_00237140 [Lucifuga dentata]|nr:hypothetical protein LDENG_00237140 [Lucifuga dentata]